jgi:hypothetical protein
VGFFNTTAVAKQPALSSDVGGQGTIQACTDTSASCGKTAVANAGTVAEVTALQTRVNDLEKALKNYGLLN